MPLEAAALPQDEFLLRRIHKNQVDAGPPILVNFTGFRPTPDDTAGLSVYREKLISPAQVAACGRKPGEYYVVRIPLRDLQALGLRVVEDDHPGEAPGHALIPELSLDACRRDKARGRELQVRLADLASRHIMHHPDV